MITYPPKMQMYMHGHTYKDQHWPILKTRNQKSIILCLNPHNSELLIVRIGNRHKIGHCFMMSCNSKVALIENMSV